MSAGRFLLLAAASAATIGASAMTIDAPASVVKTERGWSAVYAVAAKDNRVGNCSGSRHIATDIDTVAVMHVNRRAGLQLHVLANNQRVVDQIRALGRENHTGGIRPTATFSSDTPYVLAVGLQLNLLRMSACEVETELVGD